MRRLFGRLGERDIEAVRLASDRAEAEIIELGAVVRDLKVVRRDGVTQRVVLGLNTVEDYVAHAPHFGAIAGRFANRIRGGLFSLDGKSYQLPLNQDGRHCLHGGGTTGFGKQPWTLVQHDAASATLVHVSPDGFNGFPGTLTATCRFRLLGATLRIELTATTDRPTVVNLCHHSYFNLTGAADVRDHMLEVRAKLYAPTDADLIPTGELRSVTGTPLDFRGARALRPAAASDNPTTYDHTFLLRRDHSVADGDLSLAHAATMRAPDRSLALQVWTTEPALQVYDGAKVAVPVEGLDGARYGAFAGLALEPQHVPDSPNLPHFPTTTLRPGQVYRQITEYRFD